MHSALTVYVRDRCGVVTLDIGRGGDILYDAKFKEGDHPRGQPGNPGQFGNKGGATKTKNEPVKTTTNVAEAKAAHAGVYKKYLAASGTEREALVPKLKAAYNAFSAAKKAEKTTVLAKKPSPSPQNVAPTTGLSPKPVSVAVNSVFSSGAAVHVRNARAMGASIQKALPMLKFSNIYESKHQPGVVWLLVSNQQSTSGAPLTTPGLPGVTGISVAFNRFTDAPNIARIYEITSGQKGAGGKMVAAMMKSAPPDMEFDVHVDLSGGFWDYMRNKYAGKFT